MEFAFPAGEACIANKELTEEELHEKAHIDYDTVAIVSSLYPSAVLSSDNRVMLTFVADCQSFCSCPVRGCIGE